MSMLQFIFSSLFLCFSFFSSGTAIILDENDIKALCLESRSSKMVTSEVINRLMKRFDEHLSRSERNFPDKSIDELLIKSLIDDFKRTMRPGIDFLSVSNEDKSIITKYKVKQKKFASTDLNDIVAIQNGQVTSNSAITMRQTHDKIKGSNVSKKIFVFEPEISLGRSKSLFSGRSRRAAKMETHQDSSVTEVNPSESSSDFCQSLRLAEPLDSSSSTKWWAGIHSLREQLGLID